MNTSQLEKAIKIIKSDANLAGVYIKGDKTCVIGGLALATRFSKRKLEALKSTCIWSDAAKTLRRHLNREFGTNNEQLSRLQQINDGDALIRRRRKCLIEYLEYQLSIW